MKIFVIIPTLGRAACVRECVNWLERQSRRPDGVVVVGVDHSDIEGVEQASNLPVDALLWDKGSSAQRNRGLHHIHDKSDVVVFFDDDFVPRTDYLEQVEHLFMTRPDLVGVTGQMIDDGVHGTGISFADAVRKVEAHRPDPAGALHPRRGLYGCNMAVRMEAARGIRFDERMPLYGWQEDIDFSYRVGQRGPMVRADVLGGVHMGIKGGRTSGKRFGYSQIANPLYLLRKQTIPRGRAYQIMWRNLASNIYKSIRPEAHIDRRGRLAGNMLALRDLMFGTLRPERIIDL